MCLSSVNERLMGLEGGYTVKGVGYCERKTGVFVT